MESPGLERFERILTDVNRIGAFKTGRFKNDHEIFEQWSIKSKLKT